VDLPAEEVPPEVPEPALGINFARDGMQVRELSEGRDANSRLGPSISTAAAGGKTGSPAALLFLRGRSALAASTRAATAA